MVFPDTTMIEHRFLLCCAGIIVLLFTTSVNAENMSFQVRFAVAQVEGEPVVAQTWLEQHVENANILFATAEVRFSIARVEMLEEENERWPANPVTRADRHRFGPFVDPGVINVFVVRSLADVDIENRWISGVHWRSRRGGSRRHYIILSSIARPMVLAHELGHFFGNPHSPTPGNIMSYERGDGPPFFDALQLRRIRRFAGRFIREEELTIISGPRKPLSKIR